LQARPKLPKTVGMEKNGTWLCPTEADRARLVDVSDRVRKARNIAAAASGIGLLAAAPWIGFWTLGFFVPLVAQLATVDRRIQSSPRPENHVAASHVFTEAMIALIIAFSGGPRSAMLPFLVLPAGMAATRFRPRVVIAGVGIAAAMLAAVTLPIDPGYVAHNPSEPIAILCLLVGVAAITSALQGAELQHRSESVLDPLTGLLNRKTLEPRFDELRQQARVGGGSVCLVMFDLDNFKRVNDEHGHERGDAVLRDAAYGIRKSLRSFELLYRLGGEEFLMVLPGAELHEGLAIAEQLRTTVEAAEPGGVRITASFGVSAAAGEEVDFAEQFRRADRALYESKQSGRNRVSPPPLAAVA
jgi:diguanylate cyclase (GGDEF)-like protein